MAHSASPRRSTFAFDLSRPNKKGFLLKQGQYHKAFKHRFFVLYPGFLVYYDDEARWKLDIAKGETLGGRLGAVKLKNGTVSIARQAPRGCKFGVEIHAPDPANKRPGYLMNASSKEERDSWIESVRKAINHTKSPKVQRKAEPKKQLQPPHPTFTTRQDTANEAALVASNAGSATGEESEKVTSIDKEIVPSITVRHDTANVAALLGSGPVENDVEEEEQITSIDDEVVGRLLGSETAKHDSSDESGTDSRSSEVLSPTIVETNESVESGRNRKGNVEVVTKVTVAVAPNRSESPDSLGEAQRVQPGSSDVEVKSTEVIFTRTEDCSRISVTMADAEDNESTEDSSSTSSSEGEREKMPEGNKPAEPQAKSQGPSEKVENDDGAPVIMVSTVGSVVAKENKKKEENGERLSPENTPTPIRRGSTPFIEKRGFLYKMGGHRKSWKLRFFVLQPGGFSYHKNDPRSKPLGEVKLKNLQIFFPGVGERKQSYQFTVHTESSWNKRTDWILAAQSEREMKEWIAAFKIAGQKNGGTPPDSENEGASNGYALRS